MGGADSPLLCLRQKRACGSSRRQELEDEQILALRAEPRSNRLNGSGMNKIVQSRSATPYSIKRSKLHVQTCNRCDDLACCV